MLRYIRRAAVVALATLGLVGGSAAPALAVSQRCQSYQSPNNSVTVTVCADLQVPVAGSVQGRGIWYRTAGAQPTITVRNVQLLSDGAVIRETGNLGDFPIDQGSRSRSTSVAPAYLNPLYKGKFLFTIHWPNGADLIAGITSDGYRRGV